MKHIAYVGIIEDGGAFRYVTDVDWDGEIVQLFPGAAACGFQPCIAREVSEIIGERAVVIFTKKLTTFMNPDDLNYQVFGRMRKDEWDRTVAALTRSFGANDE